MSAQWNAATIFALLYLGIFPSVFAYLIFNIGVARLGAARAGLCIHLIPVFSAVLAVVFLGDSLHLYHAAGMASILAGIYMAVRVRPQINATSVPAHRLRVKAND